jgi:hypothetical protein
MGASGGVLGCAAGGTVGNVIGGAAEDIIDYFFDIPDDGDDGGESFEECTAKCDAALSAARATCAQLYNQGLLDDAGLVDCVIGAQAVHETCLDNCIADCDF